MDGDQMRSARRKLGLSIKEFAEALGGASERTVRRWEGKQKEIPPAVAEIVATWLADYYARDG